MCEPIKLTTVDPDGQEVSTHIYRSWADVEQALRALSWSAKFSSAAIYIHHQI